MMAASHPASKTCVSNVAVHRKYRSGVSRALNPQVLGVTIGLVDPPLILVHNVWHV